MKKMKTASVLAAVCVLLAGCGRTATSEFLLDTQSAAVAEDAGDTEVHAAVPEQEETLTVYVCGEVKAPGVYELPAGSRVCDALELAGGLTEQASPDYWNLAELLADGEMICFPTKEEAKERREAEDLSSASQGEAEDGKVNINTATLEQLMTLPGIGQARGQAILNYRSEHGAFSSAEDIMQVSGIGTALYENMKAYIKVD